ASGGPCDKFPGRPASIQSDAANGKMGKSTTLSTAHPRAVDRVYGSTSISPITCCSTQARRNVSSNPSSYSSLLIKLKKSRGLRPVSLWLVSLKMRLSTHRRRRWYALIAEGAAEGRRENGANKIKGPIRVGRIGPFHLSASPHLLDGILKIARNC